MTGVLRLLSKLDTSTKTDGFAPVTLTKTNFVLLMTVHGDGSHD